ncbi:Peptidyl-prolyl cis-trans isomerase [Abortiporus biennis]
MANQPPKVFLDIFIGEKDIHRQQLAAYEATCNLVQKNSTIYRFETNKPEELSEEQREILREIDSSIKPSDFNPPIPLNAGRIVFSLDPQHGLSKTRNNFISLCVGDKGFCKNAPNKKLHYLDCPIHRIVKGFVAQGGDITRGDGSGGESIYGGKFNDDKPGLKNPVSLGSLCMANSGKNSNSSQFFIVLTDDPAKLSKMAGKYVTFGEVESGWEVLKKLDSEEVVGEGEKPKVGVWIGGCGVL